MRVEPRPRRSRGRGSLSAVAEHFQETQRSWLGEQLDAGEAGREAVFRHVAETYQAPLEIYYRSTSWFREAGRNPDWSAENVIHDYLTDRLCREGFMPGWNQSGLSLRRWLINGLHFFLKEHFRAVRPGGRAAGNIGGGLSGVEVPDNAGDEADRLMIAGLVRRAVRVTEQRFEADGRGPHAEAFVRYYFEQAAVGEIAERLGGTAGQVKGMLRLGRSRFRAAFMELLGREGVDAERQPRELAAILEVLDGR